MITGIGIISALGRGRDSHVAAAAEGRSGIRAISSIDASGLDCRIAGEVPASALEGQGTRGDRFTRFALIAAAEAAAQAGLEDPRLDRTRIATVIGTGMGGSETVDAAYERMYSRGLTRMPPTTIPQSMYNAATSAVSSMLEAKGPAFAVVSACASGAHAIGQAADWVRAGRADIVICGASDAPIVPGMIRGWESLRVLSIENDSPETACRPFSADRKGLVLAEGAGILILEGARSAARRGAQILGEVAGFGLTSDAGHPTDPSAEGAARAISLALADASVQAEAIEYINAHGTATRANDVVETRAIHHALGPHSTRVPVSSTKSIHGHAMGASGAIEAALSLVALNEAIIPPTRNLNAPDPECDLDYVSEGARERIVDYFLSNSFGFGGMNAVLALRTRHFLEF